MRSTAERALWPSRYVTDSGIFNRKSDIEFFSHSIFDVTIQNTMAYLLILKLFGSTIFAKINRNLEV